MSQLTQNLNDFQRSARQVARSAHPWIAAFARIGYVAKGIVYFLMGFIAILAVIGMTRNIADQRGVMHALLAQPLGRTMLLVMAAGLSCYTLWYFAQAILDPERSGNDLKGLAKRFGQFCKGVFHVTLVWAMFRLIIGLQAAMRTLERQPYGSVLLSAVALGLISYGLYQFVRERYRKIGM